MSSIEDQRLQKWIAVLNDNDSEMSRIAAEKLRDMGRQEAVPDLIRAMEGRTMFVAAAAAHALGKIGDKSAVPALMKISNAENLDIVVRTAAVDALGDLRAVDAIPALKKIIDDYNQKYKGDQFGRVRGYERGLFTAAIRVLKEIGTREAMRIARRAERV